MVFKVRCFKCGEQEARLILGGREIIHAQCHACDSNLLAEVLEFEQQVLEEHDEWDEPSTDPSFTPTEELDEETSVV